MDCNSAKGPLDDVEFRMLLGLMDQWHPVVAKNTLARLKAGSRLAKLPPLGDWELNPDGRKHTVHERTGLVSRYRAPDRGPAEPEDDRFDGHGPGANEVLP